MQTISIRQLSLILLLSLIGPLSAYGKVGTIHLAEMAKQSDLIVIARVERVSTPLLGKKQAHAKVLETWKGNTGTNIVFLASPTWTCDISDAKKGETVLLFLRKDAKSKSTYTLAHSGRGRMPLREVSGKRYVTVEPGLWLPKEIPKIAGPDPARDYVDSFELDMLKKLAFPPGQTQSPALSPRN